MHYGSVEEMLGALDARQLLRWQAVYVLDPWGGERSDLNAATVAAAVINCLTIKKGEGVGVDKLMPDFQKAWKEAARKDDEDRQRAKAREMKLAMMVYTAKVGGVIQ